MIALLTLLTWVAVLALLVVVAVNLVRIARELEGIGGKPTSFLAKIRFGLRAIETETGQLAPRVTDLNQGLRALDGGLRGVSRDLGAALERLKGGPA